MDFRYEKLARLLLDYSLNVKEGQTVMVNAATVAEPLVQALQKATAERGVYLLPIMRPEDGQYLFYKHAKDNLLDVTFPVMKQLFETVDAMIGIHSTANPRELSRIEPTRIARHRKATAAFYEIIARREKEGAFSWVAAPFPTSAMAGDAEMSLGEYTDFVLKACGCDEDDPTAYWKKVHGEHARIIEAFGRAKTLHITGKETDLTMSVEGRTWINCDGKNNMPDGEIFTSPVEDSAEGTIYFDVPCSYNGVEVEGVRLRLEKGKVVDASAEKREEYLLKMLDVDEGARFVGEIAIGTNYHIQQPSKSILFDEKIGGTMHMAVGLSIPEAGGRNKSGLHWDMIKRMEDGGRWRLDGRTVYENGRFTV